MNTQPQSERECGPRMLMYMIKIGNYMKQLDNKYTFETLQMKLDQFTIHERHVAIGNEHSLANNTRKTILDTVQNKLVELNSI